MYDYGTVYCLDKTELSRAKIRRRLGRNCLQQKRQQSNDTTVTKKTKKRKSTVTKNSAEFVATSESETDVTVNSKGYPTQAAKQPRKFHDEDNNNNSESAIVDTV